MNNQIADFVCSLQEFQSNSKVTNQYLYPTPTHNLKSYLSIHKNPSFLFVGEAGGWHGCRQSGIPFTDGYTLANGILYRQFRQLFDFKSIQHFKERSTTIVYSVLEKVSQLFQDVLLWNAFPFHPHLEGKENTNRKPTAKERKLGESYIIKLVSLYSFSEIHAIGKVAGKTLDRLADKLGISSYKIIRHPSFGGANIFRDQMSSILKIKTLSQRKLF